MNPVIKEFWEAYYGKTAQGNETDHFYSIEGKEGGCIIIAIKAEAVRILAKDSKHCQQIEGFCDEEWVYPFRNRWNNEQAMLRLIKLKAFL